MNAPRPPVPTLHGAALVTALAELGTELQRLRSRDRIFEAAAQGLERIGMRLVVLRMIPDDQIRVEFSHTGGRNLGNALGESFVGMVGQRRRFFVADLVATTLRPSAVHSISETITTLVEKLGAEQVQALTRKLIDAGYAFELAAPMFIDGALWGVAEFTGADLRDEDAPALQLFAGLLGSAIETALTVDRLAGRNRTLAGIHALATTPRGEAATDALPTLVAHCARATDSDAAAIFLLNPAGDRLELLGCHGPASEFSGWARDIPVAGTASGQATTTLTPAIYHVESDWPESTRELVLAGGVTDTIILPLQLHGRAAGCLYVSRTTSRPYSREELEFATLLAEQVAVQMENQRLFADTRRSVNQLSVLYSLSRLGTEARSPAEVLDPALAQMVSAAGATWGTVFLLEGETMVAQALAGAGPNPEDPLASKFIRMPRDTPSLTNTAATERRTITTAEQPISEGLAHLGIRHAVAAPLTANQEVIGSFLFCRTTGRAFDADEVRLIESGAALVGTAVQRAQLFSRERRRAQDLAAINELCSLISARLALPAVLQSGVKHLRRQCEVPNAFVFLLEEELLRQVASETPRGSAPGLTIPLSSHSAATWCVRHNAPVVTVDAQTDDRTASSRIAQEYGHRGMLALPLLSEGAAIGAVVLGDTQPRHFSDAEVERAQAICHQLANAIVNARLYLDLKKSYDDLALAQAELVKRERLAAVGELAALVAHEVRNPLAVIFNSLAGLRRMLDRSATGMREPPNPLVDAPDLRLLLDIVQEEANRLNSMVSDFLDFARPNEPQLEAVALDALVEGAVEAANSAVPESSARVLVDVPGTLPPVKVDRRLFRQALINLVVNALQAMPRGGQVTIRAWPDPDSPRAARIEVADTGPGVAPEVAERLFQPFFTTKATGTGLGLAVVKRIVEAHEGEIRLESGRGPGAVFTVRVPLADADAAVARAS